MEKLLFLLAATAFLVAFFSQNGTQGFALSMAVGPMSGRNWMSSLYERGSLWFDKSLEDLEKAFDSGLKSLNEQVGKFQKDFDSRAEKMADKSELEDLKKQFNDKLEAQQKHLNQLQADKDRLKEEAKPVAKKSIMQQMEEKLIDVATKAKKENKSVKSFVQENFGSSGFSFDIDLKAVSDMTGSYALTGSLSSIMRSVQTEPGVYKDPTTPPFVRDLITVSPTVESTIHWVERTNVEGGAAQTAEGARFAQISSTYEKKTATSKKTAARMKLSEEMLEDVDYILAEAQSELIDGPEGILVTLDEQLLTGDGSGDNHKGLFAYAPDFALPTGFNKIISPNYYDAVQAAILQILKRNFTPSYLIVNPSDMMNMQLTKDSDGNYVMPPFLTQNGMVISGVRIFQNNRVTEGDFLAGQFNRAKLFINRALTVKMFDQNSTDPEYDLRTMTASMRSIFKISTPDSYAFVNGTFSGVLQAIQA